MGEIALDRRGQQNVGDGDRRAHEHRAREQRQQARLQTQSNTGGKDDHDDAEHSVHAESSRESRGEERERTVDEDRDRRQQTPHRRTQVKIAEDVTEHRPDRGDADAQIETDEDEPGAQDEQRDSAPSARHPPLR